MYLPPAPLISQLKRHEGLHLAAYRCPAGKLTIGYGHNLDANPVPGLGPESTINIEQADRLLVTDIVTAADALLKRFPWAISLDPVRLAVLVNMAVNMGVGTLASFHRTLAHIAAAEWPQASISMLASRWAGQVGDYSPDSDKGRKHGRPGRAWELAYQMRNGAWWRG